LIFRLQSAPGPSRALDAEIALANGIYEFHDKGTGLVAKSGGSWERPPRYTESIDAALTLVPDGASWEIGTYITTGKYRAYVLTDQQGSSGHGATPALALLIAIEQAKGDKA